MISQIAPHSRFQKYRVLVHCNLCGVEFSRDKYCHRDAVTCICLSCGRTGKLRIPENMSMRLYLVWKRMLSRCNPVTANAKEQKYYVAKGISVCQEWQTREGFLKWANESGYEEHLTIDRIYNAGNYEPSNCRWVTKTSQLRNTSRNVFNEQLVRDIKLQLAEGASCPSLARKYGTDPNNIYLIRAGKRWAGV